VERLCLSDNSRQIPEESEKARNRLIERQPMAALTDRKSYTARLLKSEGAGMSGAD